MRAFVPRIHDSGCGRRPLQTSYHDTILHFPNFPTSPSVSEALRSRCSDSRTQLHEAFHSFLPAIHDLLEASASAEELLLRYVFGLLSQQGIVSSTIKYEFEVPELDFFGHNLDASGTRTLLAKVEQIQEFPRPTSTTKLWQHIGLISFYLRCLSNITRLAHSQEAPLANAKMSTPPCPGTNRGTT